MDTGDSGELCYWMGRVHALHVKLCRDHTHDYDLDKVRTGSYCCGLSEGCLQPRITFGHLCKASSDYITLGDKDCAHCWKEKGRPLAEHGNYGDEVFRKLSG